MIWAALLLLIGTPIVGRLTWLHVQRVVENRIVREHKRAILDAMSIIDRDTKHHVELEYQIAVHKEAIFKIWRSRGWDRARIQHNYAKFFRY